MPAAGANSPNSGANGGSKPPPYCNFLILMSCYGTVKTVPYARIAFCIEMCIARLLRNKIILRHDTQVVPDNFVLHRTITCHAAMSFSSVHAALAGLVDGRQTAGFPICGKI